MRSGASVLLASALAVLVGPLGFAQVPPRPRRTVTPPRPDRVVVPEGPCVLGADAGGEPDERPRHRVVLPAFSLDRTEVTVGAWRLCVAAGACTAPRPLDARFQDPQQPVVGVSWFQARAYCAWAGGRLPTESEWEKAARGTDGRTYPWGEQRPNDALAVFGRSEATGRPDRVGSRPRGASPYGALDLAGNVWEWTESPYDPYAYQRPGEPSTCERALASLADLRARGVRGFTGSNPLPTTCERVLRGGGWNYGGAGLRSSNRVHHAPNFRLVMSGFRCASDAPREPSGTAPDAGHAALTTRGPSPG